ncbi:DUF4132 domain-containing protein [Rhodococcus sp. 077-4]|uniref:DUF4132 domain-containing protein n=1 Tax=Rhodococcus sp. 077-4 TaxID=2789271 RepID=UPI0039F4A4F1
MTAGRDAWTVPVSWWRRGEAMHGRTPVATRKFRPPKTSVIEALVGDAHRIREVVDHPDTDPAVAAAGSAFLRARAVGALPTPRALAFALTVTIDYVTYKQHAPFVDEVIASHGAGFAAEMVVEAAGMQTQSRYERGARGDVSTLWATERLDMDMLNFGIRDAHSRVRTAVAALPTDDYRGVIDALAPLRGASYSRDLLTSFLFPTESTWVAADMEAAAHLGQYHEQDVMPLLACVASHGDVERILSMIGTRDTAIWALGMRMNLVHALCANLGPGTEPLIGELFDGNLSAQNKKRCAAILAEFDTDEGFMELGVRLGRKYVEPATLTAIENAPQRAHRLLTATAGPRAAALLADIERLHPELAEDSVPVDRRAASTETLPALLTEPPWLGDRRQPDVSVHHLPAPDDPIALAWLPGEREQFADKEPQYEMYLGLRTWPEIARPVAEGSNAYNLYEISRGPASLIAPLLVDAAVPRWIFRADADLRRLLFRFDTAAVEFVFRVVLARPAFNASVLAPVTGTRVTEAMADWLDTKAMRPVALQWFDRHIDSAATVIVVAALADPSAERVTARKALRTLAKRGHRDALVAASAPFGPAASSAVTDLVDSDPLFDLPNRIPTLPEWLDPALLPSLVLTEDNVRLTSEAVRTVCTMFALSRLDEVYAGIAIVRTWIAPLDMASLAWALFERWSKAGFPDAQRWCLDALGIVGNDETAQRLAPYIRAWPLQSAHRRAAAGLDVLAAIGTDSALGHIWSIAQGLRFPALRAKADARIRRIADELGLSPAELADRLIPDLGLDADGATVFDYGTRSFTLSLDHTLRIVITEGTGKTRARLPRPTPDDSKKAAEAFKQYSTLRRDLEAARGELLQRFERAMVGGRKWAYEQLRIHLVGHPVAWQIVGRLVWATEAGTLFAFSDSRIPVNIDGSLLAIGDTENVVIVHPFEMGNETTMWTEEFDAAKRAQPFEQLHRAVHRGDVASHMGILDNTKTTTAQLLNLERLGWEREEPQDKGAQISINKRIDDDTVAVIMVFPGFNVASPALWHEQKIVHAFVTNNELHGVAASELLRDVATIETTPIRGDEPDLQGP